MHIAVLGGGAAGFFGAIHAAENNRDASITLFEKSGKLLSKVLVSGGGRCNVTHACFDNSILVQHYPRGHKELRGPFEQFTTKDTIKWFESRGIRLKTEPDGRMFPVTDKSETIANCLLQEAERAGIKIKLNQSIIKISPAETGFELAFADGNKKIFDRILIATGGGPKLSFFDWMRDLELNIISPVPSLFTFNIADKSLQELAGISVPDTLIRIKDSKLEQRGPLLITHWGVSGPAILKLSAWGARELYDREYKFEIRLSWLTDIKEDDLRDQINQVKTEHNRKQTGSFSPFGFPSRLWKWLLVKSEIIPELHWADVSKKQVNKLVNNLIQMELPVTGKSTFKEEFVTAGGVNLKEINLKTMESKKHKGLFFAGEVLDIDGITGGFNFQSAWTTGFIAGKNIARQII
jgi:predicted Rossmann fold flavoprotein